MNIFLKVLGGPSTYITNWNSADIDHYTVTETYLMAPEKLVESSFPFPVTSVTTTTY